jgi:uncharacterized phiE125 gp8 family phage protein
MHKNTELLEQSKSNFITLKHAKQYLRVENDYDDEIIQEMIDIVAEAAENYLCFQLKESKYKLTLYNQLPSKIKLSYGPVTKIESFKLYKHNQESSYLEEQYYILDKFAEQVNINHSHSVRKVEITYHSGYSAELLPKTIKQGMLEHLSKLYDLRGGDQAMPLSAKSLYQAYKRVRF